jgi:hypothetical protein
VIARTDGPPTWAAFALWAVLGAAVVLGFFTFTVLFVVPIVIGVVAFAIRPRMAKSALGLLAGMGLVSIYVAYVQRRGPGPVCYQTATGGSGCDEYLNPWPWLVVGVVLVSVAIVAHTRMMRRARVASRSASFPQSAESR